MRQYARELYTVLFMRTRRVRFHFTYLLLFPRPRASTDGSWLVCVRSPRTFARVPIKVDRTDCERSRLEVCLQRIGRSSSAGVSAEARKKAERARGDGFALKSLARRSLVTALILAEGLVGLRE